LIGGTFIILLLSVIVNGKVRFSELLAYFCNGKNPSGKKKGSPRSQSFVTLGRHRNASLLTQQNLRGKVA